MLKQMYFLPNRYAKLLRITKLFSAVKQVIIKIKHKRSKSVNEKSRELTLTGKKKSRVLPELLGAFKVAPNIGGGMANSTDTTTILKISG